MLTYVTLLKNGCYYQRDYSCFEQRNLY